MHPFTMKKILVVLTFLSASLYFYSCHSRASDRAPEKDSTLLKPAAPVAAVHSPEFREHPKKEAVAEYIEEKHDMNNWSFSVRLYETDKTVSYRLKMKYETLEGDDTLRLPDLGTPPRPVIQKGKDKYSCVVGFMDNDGQFREYKLVYVKGEVLGTKTLKHYSVTQGYRLVSLEPR